MASYQSKVGKTLRKKHSRSRTVTIVTNKMNPALLILLCLVLLGVFAFGGYKLFFDYIPATFQPDDEIPKLDVSLIKNQELSIHFLELGNKFTGDCTLVKVGDVEVLIDAGSRVNSIPTITKYLNQYVDDKIIEYVIVTHAHRDHYAGFATSTSQDSIFDLYDVKTVIQFAQVTEETKSKQIYGNYQRELSELQARCATKVYTAKDCMTGDNGALKEYELSENIKLEILDQCYYYEVASDENNHSVCCQIVQNDSKYYLFTGDLESAGETSLVASNELQQVELYKAGHHGSGTSSSDTLLEVIKPKHVCVCCCAGSSEYTDANENQFPTQEFIDRIAPYTDEVYVTTLSVDYANNNFTSMNGNIVIFNNQTDETITIKCSNHSTKLKNTKWFNQNRILPPIWYELTA